MILDKFPVRFSCLQWIVAKGRLQDQRAGITGLLQYFKKTIKVSITLTPEVKVGDYVLLHTGYAISVIDQAEAKETLEMLKEMIALGDEAQ